MPNPLTDRLLELAQRVLDSHTTYETKTAAFDAYPAIEVDELLDFIEVHVATVAELFEADEVFDTAQANLRFAIETGKPQSCVQSMRLSLAVAEDRRAAALARVGHEPA